MVKARKAGGAQPVAFSKAQTEHMKAFEEALKRRYAKLWQQEEKKAREERLQNVRISRRDGRVPAEMMRDKLREWADDHAVFDVSEYRLLQMSIQSNASDETRHKAAQLLNERAFLATGGKMGTMDAIERAKRTRARPRRRRPPRPRRHAKPTRPPKPLPRGAMTQCIDGAALFIFAHPSSEACSFFHARQVAPAAGIDPP